MSQTFSGLNALFRGDMNIYGGDNAGDGDGSLYVNHKFLLFGTDESTDATSGALVVSGGGAFKASLTVGHDLTVNNNSTLSGTLSVVGNATFQPTSVVVIAGTNDTSSTSTGQLQVVGGLGLGGGIFVGGAGTVVGVLSVTNTTNSTSVSHGAVIVSGGLGIAKDTYVGGLLNVGGNATVSGDLEVTGNIYAVGGTVNFSNTTDSTTSSNGSIVVDGGVGIAKNLNVGGNEVVTGSLTVHGGLIFDNTTDATSTSTGALVVAGGVGIGKQLWVGGVVHFVNTTNASSASSGALQVSGGFGVAKAAYIGGLLDVTGNSTMHGTLTVVGNTTVQGVFTNAGTIVSSTATSGFTDTTQSADTTTGAVVVAGGVGIGMNLNVGGNTHLYGNVTVDGTVTLTSTTDSTSVDTGCLVLDGGLGVAKSIVTGGPITITNTTASTSKTTGALIVAGGAGISGQISASGPVLLTDGRIVKGTSVPAGTSDLGLYSTTSATNMRFVTNAGEFHWYRDGGVGTGDVMALDASTLNIKYTTASSSTSSGALVVGGGAGIGSDVVMGGNLYLKNTSFVSTGTDVYLNASSDTLYLRNTAGSNSGEFNSTMTNFNFMSTTSTPYSILDISKPDGIVYINTTTNSTGTGTGALQVAGGGSVAKDFYVGGNIVVTGSILSAGTGPTTFSSTYDSTSPTTGSIVTPGGMGIGKSLVVGYHIVTGYSGYTAGPTANFLTVTGATFTDNATSASGTATAWSSTNIGVATYTATNLGVTVTDAASLNVAGAPITGTNASFTNVWALRVQSGKVLFGGTTDSTSYNSGSVQVAGGIAVAKNLWVAGGTTTLIGPGGPGATAQINMSSYLSGSGVSTNQISVTDDGSYSGSFDFWTKAPGADTNALVSRLHIASTGELFVSSTAESTDPTVGALVVAGGLGVSKRVNLGSNLTFFGGSMSLVNRNDNLQGLTVCGGTANNTNAWLILNSAGTASGNAVLGSPNAVQLVYYNGTAAVKHLQVNVNGVQVFTDNFSAAPNVVGQVFGVQASTFTDSGTSASGTLSNWYASFIGVPTLAAHNSSVTTTNAATLYIAGAPTAGTNETITNAYALWVGGTAATRFDTLVSLTNTTHATGTGTGALSVAGGFSVTKNSFFGGTLNTMDGTGVHWNLMNSSGVTYESIGLDSSGNLVFTPYAGFDAPAGPTVVFSNTDGSVIINSTTNSRSPSTGSLVTYGGAGIALNLYVGGNTNIGSTTVSTSPTSGALVVAGGAGIGGNTNIGGTLNVYDTTASTSPTTGAVVIAGGTGIGGNLNVGGNTSITGTLTVTGGIQNTSTNESTSVSTGSLVLLGGLGVAKSVYIGGTAHVVNTTDASSTTTGALVIAGGAGFGGNIYGGANVTIPNANTFNGGYINLGGSSSANTIAGTVSITNTTGATSTSTGTLVVSGGVGIGQALYVSGLGTFGGSLSTTSTLTVGGTATVNDTTQSTSCSTGALTVAGGAGIARNLNVCGNETIGGTLTVTGISTMQSALSITDTTESTSTTTGCLILSGGAGIAKSVNIGGTLTVGGSTTINGNLTVIGTTSTIDTTTVTIQDNIILVNSAPAGSSDGGFGIKRFQCANDTAAGDVIQDDVPFYTGTARAGGSATTFVLNTGASAVNNDYAGMWVLITGGTGANQVRRIKTYDGTTKMATVYSANDQSTMTPPPSPIEGMDWTAIPNGTSTFALYDGQYILTYFDEINDRYVIGATAVNPTSAPFVSVRETVPVLMGNLYVNGFANVDTINEYTANAGVTVEGVLIKDNNLSSVGTINGTLVDVTSTIGLTDNTTARTTIPGTATSGAFTISVRSQNGSGAMGIFMCTASGGNAGNVSRLVSSRGTNNEMVDIEWHAGTQPRIKHTNTISGASGATINYVVRVTAV